jgi:hypothetical protein
VKLEFHPAAAEEFAAAAEYYEAAVSGLGNRFLVVVQRRPTACSTIQKSVASGDARVASVSQVFRTTWLNASGVM